MIDRNALEHISKYRVDKAGKALRGHALGEIDLTETELEGERAVAEEFRRAHGQPLQTVKANLAYHVNQVADVNVVSQRLKRLPTIEDKLVRHPRMALSRMHDVGGCRAVVGREDQLREVERRLREARGWAIKPGTEYDYIASPKPDGYRAVHLIERRHGCQIEVQLRTMPQHLWAELVERADRETRFGQLKLGRAPDWIRDYYSLGADLLAARERNEDPDLSKVERFRELSQEVLRRGDRKENRAD